MSIQSGTDHQLLISPDSIVFRRAGEELVVIDTKTGIFHHFSADSEPFLLYFRKANTLASYCESHSGATFDELERAYLRDFCGQLLSLGILSHATETSTTRDTHGVPPESHLRPRWLRQGERRLDEITVAFLYP